MKIVSLLKHDVVLRLPDGSDRVYPPSGKVAELVVRQSIEWVEVYVPNSIEPDDLERGWTETVDVAVTEYGTPEGLPPYQEGTLYLVSSLLASRCARKDLIAPDTGPTAIRRDGHVVAVVRFQRF